jgi:hypothetical protein
METELDTSLLSALKLSQGIALEIEYNDPGASGFLRRQVITIWQCLSENCASLLKRFEIIAGL